MGVKVLGNQRYNCNGTFGISDDKHSPMYDPKMARDITINCQLLLLDLLEKLELQMGDRCTCIQANTDGLIFKIHDKNDFDEYKSICNEWEERTLFELEHDLITKIWNRDVNNYMFVFENGKVEVKGSVVQMNNPLKNDMSIINESIRNYLLNGTPIEDTILNCDELIKFQHISKIGSTYKEVEHNGKTINGKVMRTFASTREEDGEVYKIKYTIKNGEEVKSLTRLSDSSAHCFIDNGCIIDKKCPEYLDKMFYVELAKKRLKGFINKK